MEPISNIVAPMKAVMPPPVKISFLNSVEGLTSGSQTKKALITCSDLASAGNLVGRLQGQDYPNDGSPCEDVRHEPRDIPIRILHKHSANGTEYDTGVPRLLRKRRLGSRKTIEGFDHYLMSAFAIVP